MAIEREELSKLIPQKGKMFLVERITDYDLEKWTIESETKITEDFMFYDKTAEGVPNYATFEIIAQTIAALTGLSVREKNAEPKMGFILSVSNLKYDFNFIRPGQTVGVKACRETEMDNVQSFSAVVLIDGKECGHGKLTAMEAV